MNEKISAGLLMFSFKSGQMKIFLVHPAGPFFIKKDDGFWSIPKGLVEENEDLLDAAKREFFEETGTKPEGEFISLGSVKQKNNKIVHAWAFESQLDNPMEINCNTFEIEWPPKSGIRKSFPEVDKGEFFSADDAKTKINSAQQEFITRLLEDINR